MMPTVKITAIRNFGYDEQNGNWSGETDVEVSTSKGTTRLVIPFSKEDDLADAQIRVLLAVDEWAKEIAQATSEALKRMPKRP